MPGQWHNNWEDEFSKEDTEWSYIYKSRFGKKVERRCDVRLNEKNIVEFQHSVITKDEVKNRKVNYNEHGKDIIWMLDGSNISLTEVDDDINNNGKYLLEKIPNWMIYPFLIYTFVLIDIGGKIFKIRPDFIKTTNICITSVFKTREETIILFKNLKNKVCNVTEFWNSWNTKHEKIGKFIRVQMGAGNGKTYNLWKTICETTTKSLFLVLTKIGSAVTVLLEELEAQRKRQCAHLFDLIDIDIQPYTKTSSTKYVIKYKHKKTGKEVIIIIGTIDSFGCSLRNLPQNVQNKFMKLQEELYKMGPSKISKIGGIKYGGENIKLNKNCQIWIDEAQDLPMNYFNALVTLMMHTGIDIGMAGDKMQSISHEQNLFTKIKEDIKSIQDQIELIDIPPNNINRRIKSKHLAKVINQIIRFEEFDCLPIQNTETDGDGNELQDNGSYEEVFSTFLCPTIYGKDSSTEKQEKSERFADINVDIMRNEIKKYYWLPNHFLINSIIVSNKPELQELEAKIQEMWEVIMGDAEYRNKIPDNNYWKKNNHIDSPNNAVKYVQFHKSENGQPIKLSESEYKTRITSTMTSKGMGREIVISVGVTESSLKTCANHIRKLCYESLFHVAVTRAKIRQYFQLTPNSDDIHRRFFEKKGVFYEPKIREVLNINTIVRDADKSLFIKLLSENGINENIFAESEKRRNIDFNHHMTRQSAWTSCLIHKILFNQMNSPEYETKTKRKGQIQTMFNKMCVPTRLLTTKNYYNYLSQYAGLDRFDKEFTSIPILKKARNNAYIEHTNIIKKHILHIQNNILIIDQWKTPLDYIIFCHILSLIRNKSHAEPDINSLYRVIDIFTSNKQEDEKIFFNKLKDINKILHKFIEKLNKTYGYLDWNIFHKIQYSGGTDEFVLQTKGIPLIGYNDSSVVHIILKPTANSINIWDIMVDVLLQRFMIFNPKGKDLSEDDRKKGKKDNKFRYENKKIKTFVIVLETGEIVPIDDNFYKDFNDEIIVFLKESITITFNLSHKELYAYCIDVKDHFNDRKKNKNILNNKKISKNTDVFKSYSTPWEYLKDQTKNAKYPSYIIHFFTHINKLWRKKEKDKVRKFFDTEEAFTNELNDELNATLNKFFRISNMEDTDDEDF